MKISSVRIQHILGTKDEFKRLHLNFWDFYLLEQSANGIVFDFDVCVSVFKSLIFPPITHLNCVIFQILNAVVCNVT